MQRRTFMLLSFAAASAMAESVYVSEPRDDQPISDVAFPEKKPLITYSNRPPLLETPVEYFTSDITPNELFFVRWHMPVIPTVKWIDSYTLHVSGEVENELSLSLHALKNDFKSVTVTATQQCGGNSRSAFHPTPVGIQWGNGAMGCATFKGVRLKDILKKASPNAQAQWVSFNGLDRPVKSDIPIFKRELHIDEIGDDVIVAYEMNGEELPFLNGYPLRLVIPGWYADSWVKQLSQISVTTKYQPTFFMDVAYRIPDNECRCEEPAKPAKKSRPLAKMDVKSVIALPKNRSSFKLGSTLTLKGVAFDGGSGIAKVEFSLDGGKSWQTASLKAQRSPYAFVLFEHRLKPLHKGKMRIMVRATAKDGSMQPFAHEIGWNHGGYGYNGIDSVEVEIV